MASLRARAIAVPLILTTTLVVSASGQQDTVIPADPNLIGTMYQQADGRWVYCTRAAGGHWGCRFLDGTPDVQGSAPKAGEASHTDGSPVGQSEPRIAGPDALRGESNLTDLGKARGGYR